MILESVENGPLIWPTIEENGVTRPRKYSELTHAEAIQADCDVKATNIILQVFKQGDDPIDAINHMMSFLSAVFTSRYPTTNNQLRNSSNPRQQATINDGRVTLQPVQGRQVLFATDKVLLVQAQANGQILHEEELALADLGIAEDFENRFVPQTKLSAEQAFWFQNSMNSSYPSPYCRPIKVEVPKELPKVSMVNTSLKKLKHHLAGFDVVVKERTTTIAITEGLWRLSSSTSCEEFGKFVAREDEFVGVGAVSAIDVDVVDV
nr:hypothetical protein [Tanacetum cinerariifolium]